MTNLYWSVYKNLEKELIELSNQIHFDDKQISIYSVKISELLIRCCVEIESISKDLFFRLGGTLPEDGELYFDTHCLQLLETNWLLSKKKIILSAPNFYFKDDENRVITPLYKSYKRGSSGSDWKKAYQAVKHNRVKNLTDGNIKNLIKAMAALFILNIYFKDEVYSLEKDSNANIFPINLGSDIFSIKFHKMTSYDENANYRKEEDFDECIYLNKWIDSSIKEFKEGSEKVKSENTNYILRHPKFIEWLKNNKIEEYKGTNLAYDVLGKNEYIKMLKHSSSFISKAVNNIQYEAILNKHEI